jgi:YD repeat-containing protein
VEQTSDGSIQRGEWWVFDPAGKLLEYEIQETSPAAGPPLTRYVYVYDDEGYLIHEEAHSNDDGKPESQTDYTYDGSGYLTTAVSTLDLISMVYQVTTEYSYDGQGRLTAIQQGPDETRYTYDASGNLILRELDEGSDGTVQERDTYDFSCRG